MVVTREEAVLALVRRLGTGDAVVVGLSSMIGGGLFGAFGPAAAPAGPWLLVGLALAAGIAFCNASSSAALAALYPSSGGTYVYGRHRLGHFWGFLAGWGFVIGKTASCAAMALTAASYLVPDHPKIAAAGFALALGAVNYAGVTRTTRLARALLALTLLAVTTALIGVWLGGDTGPVRQWGSAVSPWGVLQSAGLLFFAFAGYARIATLGEEVRDPARTIPRAIPLALLLVVALYFVVGGTLLAALGADGLAGSSSPLADAVRGGALAWLAPAAVAGAGFGSLGALLALFAGVGRTTLAMARERDLPGSLAPVHPRFGTPYRAQLAVTGVVVVLVLVSDLRAAIGFSSFGVLVYYAIANASAFTLPPQRRRFPRALPVTGVAGCCLLAVSLPWPSVAGGLVCFAVGTGVWFARSVRRP